MFLAGLAGCATFEKPIPTGYEGPIAAIGEDGSYEESSRGKLFYVESIDGKRVESGLALTRRATANLGFRVILQYAVHQVPAKPLRIKIVGTHVTGAPIHEIAARAAGTFYSVEGEIDFTPEADGAYFVTGQLEKGTSTVWIAEVKTKKRVSSVVSESKK